MLAVNSKWTQHVGSIVWQLMGLPHQVILMAKHKERVHNLFPRWSRGRLCELGAKKIVKGARHLQNTGEKIATPILGCITIRTIAHPLFEQVC